MGPAAGIALASTAGYFEQLGEIFSVGLDEDIIRVRVRRSTASSKL